MQEVTRRSLLLRKFSELNLSWDTQFEIAHLIGPYKDKQARCGEVYEAIKDCRNQEEVIEAIKKQYGVTINPDRDEEENEEETDIP